jgi:hypothetical protein
VGETSFLAGHRVGGGGRRGGEQRSPEGLGRGGSQLPQPRAPSPTSPTSSCTAPRVGRPGAERLAPSPATRAACPASPAPSSPASRPRPSSSAPSVVAHLPHILLHCPVRWPPQRRTPRTFPSHESRLPGFPSPELAAGTGDGWVRTTPTRRLESSGGARPRWSEVLPELARACPGEGMASGRA